MCFCCMKPRLKAKQRCFLKRDNGWTTCGEPAIQVAKMWMLPANHHICVAEQLQHVAVRELNSCAIIYRYVWFTQRKRAKIHKKSPHIFLLDPSDDRASSRRAGTSGRCFGWNTAQCGDSRLRMPSNRWMPSEIADFSKHTFVMSKTVSKNEELFVTSFGKAVFSPERPGFSNDLAISHITFHPPCNT